METNGDVEAFRQQLLARAASKKRRLERQIIEHQQALESKRQRNAKPLEPKPVQDVLNLVIAFAVPDVFEIKILRKGKEQFSLMDGSEGGQVSNLDHISTLMRLNHDCLHTVMQGIAHRMTIRIRVWETTNHLPSWEFTLNLMLFQKNSRFSILANASTIEIQDVLCCDFREPVSPDGNWHLFYNERQKQVKAKYGADPIRDRYLRRSTATFKRRDRSAIPTYVLRDINYHRFSLSTPLDHNITAITSIFASCGSNLVLYFRCQPSPKLIEDDKIIVGSIWAIVEGVIVLTENFGCPYFQNLNTGGHKVGQAKLHKAEEGNKENEEPTRYFMQLCSQWTIPVFEEIKDHGWWEEDEMWSRQVLERRWVVGSTAYKKG